MVNYFKLGLAGVAVLFVAGAVTTVVVLSAKLDTAEAKREALTEQLGTALETNKAQVAVITRMTEQRLIDDKLVTTLNTQLVAIRDQTTATAEQLVELERTDPDAKSFLSIPVPPSVKRLYSNR